MDANSRQLRTELISFKIVLDRQMEVVAKAAEDQGCRPIELRNPDGTWVLIPLLAAKAQVLNGLAVLSEKK